MIGKWEKINCAMIKMNKIWVINNVSKLVLSPFALCKIISKAIELMADFCEKKSCPWSVSMGKNNHFINR